MKNKPYLVTFLLAIVVAFSGNVYSFSVDNHKVITRLSIDLINDCGIKNSISESDVDTLVEYNVYQDKLLKKSILWHFPMPAEGSNNPIPDKKHASGYGKIVEETTFNRWVDYLEDQASKEKDLEGRLPAIGALLHFTQDLAVPSHAIPIFHPSKIANPDKLDNWDVEKLNMVKLKAKGVSACKGLEKIGVGNVASLNADVREDTLLSLNEKLNNCPENGGICNWTALWETNVIDTGFAYYGCGKEDMFGSNKFSCDGFDYRISTDENNQFVAVRFDAAIVASAKLILHFMHLEPGNRSACADSQWVPRRKHLKCLKSTNDNT